MRFLFGLIAGIFLGTLAAEMGIDIPDRLLRLVDRDEVENLSEDIGDALKDK